MKFCLWGEIGTALKGETIGGAELQMALLARSLALNGHEVVIIDPSSSESFITEEGVKVVHVHNWNNGIPFFRIFIHRIPTLYKLLVKEEADFYYSRTRSYFNLVPYWAAKKVKGKFLLALASDLDIMKFSAKFKYDYRQNFNIAKFINQWLPGDLAFGFLIKRSDFVICQHTDQQITLTSLKGKQVLFHNIIDRKNLPEKNKSANQYFIYVGSLSMLKGADRLLEIIKSQDKSIPFVIVGQPKDKGAKKVYKSILKLNNADIRGRHSHDETMKLLAGAKALINTSHFEGFPNVFLEAWSLGVPVLSLKVNPENILNKPGMGMCFKGDIDKMKNYISDAREIWANQEEMTLRIEQYHDFKNADKRFIHALDEQ